jgi:hypothetical protein
MLSMVSDFLINFGGDQFPVDQGVLTYVRLCTLK